MTPSRFALPLAAGLAGMLALTGCAKVGAMTRPGQAAATNEYEAQRALRAPAGAPIAPAPGMPTTNSGVPAAPSTTAP